MANQYTAIVEKDRDWFIIHCLEIPGASGLGPSLEAAKVSLAEAIVLILRQQADESGERLVH